MINKKIEVNSKLNELLFKNSVHTALYNFVLAVIIIYFLPKDEYFSITTIIWLSLMLFSVALRFFSGLFSDQYKTLHIFTLQIISIFFTGCLWGYLYWHYYDPNTLFQHMMILIVLSGISAGSIISMAPSRLCYLAFTLPMIISIIISNLNDIYNEGAAIIVLSLVYYIFLVSIHQKNNKLLLKNYNLEVKRNWLIRILNKKNQVDDLTGVLNRKTFRQIAKRELSFAKKKDKNLSIIFCDIDHFKMINDKYGHHMGDKVLKYFSELLKANFKQYHIARIGGDEFSILVSHLKHINQIKWIAKELANLAPESITIDGHRIKLSLSIGAASYPFSGNNLLTLERNADISLYKAKELGRNRYVVFSDEIYNDFLKNEAIADAINQPFQQNFTFKYQPIYQISADEQAIKGVELLLRPKGNLSQDINAIDIIQIAENRGQMKSFGFHLLNIALSEIVHISSIYPDYVFTINIPTSLIETRIDQQKIIDLVHFYGLSASQIIFEIKESSLNSSKNAVIDGIKKFSQHGYQVAIDDFGKGYSSLAKLSHIPANILKLDMAFIHHIEHDSNMQNIVKWVIQLANSLHLNVIAEGIENQDQLNIVQALGCSLMQGYYLCKPLSKEELTAGIDRYTKTLIG
ncbi:bifunctional diguanylate cyclase/phosphodiesterase [Thiotrichales bacterium 19S11-10]|nr:bifunctional diguanylate cyclase/phosphodiesterase [Thiotrichales bacterium 19S11-10]